MEPGLLLGAFTTLWVLVSITTLRNINNCLHFIDEGVGSQNG